MPPFDPRPFLRAGAAGAVLQLLGVVAIAATAFALGGRPSTAEEAFAIHRASAQAFVLRNDLLILTLLILPYLLTFPALFLALRRQGAAVAAFSMLFVVIGVVGATATESTFSLLHLAERYAAATTEAQRNALVAAGEAVIAGDLWNGTAAYVGGFLLQGPGVAISLLMLRSTRFHRTTAWSGLAANGLDLVQHALHPVLPAVSGWLAPVMGVFYLVWFPMLAWDLIRLARSGLAVERVASAQVAPVHEPESHTRA